MKKLVIILSIIVGILALNKEVISPENSIRFRVIANSDEEKDQKVKKEIVKNLSKELISYQPRTIEEERNYLQSKIPSFSKQIEEYVEDYTIDYGNHYFPEKEYKNITYPEGFYESLVITLGEGRGHNFWCILFPPLCFEEEEEDVEYNSFIKDTFIKIFHIK